MSSRWFLLIFTTVLCVSRVENKASVPRVLSSGQGVVDESNPRSNEDVSKINAMITEPSKTNDTKALPKPDVHTGKEVPISENGKIKQTVKPAVDSNVVHNDSEITENFTSHHNRSGSFYSSIKTMRERLSLDNGAVKRTFYVVAGLTGIVLLYFMIKGITMKRKPKVPRYGLLSEREMEGFDDGDDEDEDTTLFDAARYKKKSRGP